MGLHGGEFSDKERSGSRLRDYAVDPFHPWASLSDSHFKRGAYSGMFAIFNFFLVILWGLFVILFFWPVLVLITVISLFASALLSVTTLLDQLLRGGDDED